MKNALFIEFANEKIVMTTTFAKKCSNTASAEYAQLQSVRRDYPTFNVTTRKIKSNPNKETYAGLTYEYMREYIITHASAETRAKEVAEFDELILISKCQTKAKRYPTIKKWFLAKYPAIAKFGMAAETETEVETEEKSANVIHMAEAAEANDQNLKQAS